MENSFDKHFFIGYCSSYGSCYTLNYIYPFLPNMILYFGYKEEEKGYYAGIIASGLFFGRIFSSFIWGLLSDHYGHKPIVIIMFILVAVVNVCFGFAETFEAAVGLRVLCGFMNSIIVTSKAIIYEVSDTSNQAAGMTTISMSWGLGVITGPLISGYTSEPHKNFPHLVSSASIFARYPFLLPSVISGIICIIGAITTYLFIPTHIVKKNASEIIDIEQTTNETVLDKELNTGPRYNDSLITETTPKSNSVGYLEKYRKSPIALLLSNRLYIMIIIIFGLCSFTTVGSDDLFTIWASTETRLDGLGFHPSDIGYAMSVSAIPLICLQIYVFPFCEHLFGTIRTFNYAALLLIFFTITLPACRIFITRSSTLWCAILLANAIRSLCRLTCFSCTSLLLNNCAPGRRVGLANGFAMGFSGVFRAAAPSIGGAVYSWSVTRGRHLLGPPFDVNAVFIMFGASILAANVVCSMLPAKLNRKPSTG